MKSPERLSTEEAADYLDVRPHTLEVWRTTGRYGIPFIKVGRLVKYSRADLDAWLAMRTVNATASRDTA